MAAEMDMTGESGENDALLGADRSGSADHSTADNEAADGARRRKGVPQGRKVAEAILEVCNKHTGHFLSGLLLWFVICVFCSKDTSEFFSLCSSWQNQSTLQRCQASDQGQKRAVQSGCEWRSITKSATLTSRRPLYRIKWKLYSGWLLATPRS